MAYVRSDTSCGDGGGSPTATQCSSPSAWVQFMQSDSLETCQDEFSPAKGEYKIVGNKVVAQITYTVQDAMDNCEMFERPEECEDETPGSDDWYDGGCDKMGLMELGEYG